MYIQPNSTIKLLKDVPLDASYDHTIFFGTPQEQVTYFNNFVKYTFTNQTYQRLNKGWFKIEIPADDIYDCNYVMYQNTSYGNKWFYAFIRTIEYINDNVSKVQYEIDVMQTWDFDYQLGQCFIERQHSKTDDIGDNLIPEPVGLGEEMYADSQDLLKYDFQQINTRELCVVVAAPFNKGGTSESGGKASNLYSGVKYNIFVNTQSQTIIQQLNSFLNSILGASKADQIVTMFYYFKDFAVQSGTQETPIEGVHNETVYVTKDYNGFKNDYTDGNEQYYVPRNKKLFTAPYNYFTITSFDGHQQDYCYEFFHYNSNGCPFNITGGLSCTPAIAFVPLDYMGYGSLSTSKNFDYAFWYTSFPKIAWNSDGFVAWLAQTGVALGAKVAGDYIASGGLMALSNNMIASGYNDVIMNGSSGKGGYGVLDPVGASGELMPMQNTQVPLNFSVGNIMASGALAALKGNRTNGTNSFSPNWYCNNIRVSAVKKKIRKDWAKRIDQYFDMFGYAQNVVEVPQQMTRTNWTYTKTLGCVLATANLPSDDARKICSIYDRGITFWDKNATVGDYTQANNPII